MMLCEVNLRLLLVATLIFQVLLLRGPPGAPWSPWAPPAGRPAEGSSFNASVSAWLNPSSYICKSKSSLVPGVIDDLLITVTTVRERFSGSLHQQRLLIEFKMREDVLPGSTPPSRPGSERSPGSPSPSQPPISHLQKGGEVKIHKITFSFSSSTLRWKEI